MITKLMMYNPVHIFMGGSKVKTLFFNVEDLYRKIIKRSGSLSKGLCMCMELYSTFYGSFAREPG